jgi:hypothetical protein
MNLFVLEVEMNGNNIRWCHCCRVDWVIKASLIRVVVLFKRLLILGSSHGIIPDVEVTALLTFPFWIKSCSATIAVILLLNQCTIRTHKYSYFIGLHSMPLTVLFQDALFTLGNRSQRQVSVVVPSNFWRMWSLLLLLVLHRLSEEGEH